MLAVNLALPGNFAYNNQEYQCSYIAAQLTGSIFTNGLNMTQFERYLRQSGFKVLRPKFNYVIAS